MRIGYALDMAVEEATGGNYSWSREEEKAFENALAIYTDDCDERWEKIAADVPGKSVDEIMHHYQLLEEDVDAIESGLVPLPSYPSSSSSKSTIEPGSDGHGNGHDSSKGSRLEQDRRKGIAWTEEEHRLFLLGLEKYGKGDWRSISRNFVVTRTPTQVASHAQKFFIRLNSGNKDRKRSSIHDITTVGHVDAPVTAAQMNDTMPTPVNSSNQSSQKPPESPGVGIYGTAIGHPVGAGLVPSIGTPGSIPVPWVQQVASGVQTPVTNETIVSEAPVNLPPRSHPMPHKSVSR